MDWSDERWVKLYVRSSVAWQVASFNARGLYYEMMRLAGKDSDRVKLGRHGADGLARLVGLSVTECNAALRELTEGNWIAFDCNADDCVRLIGHLEQQQAQSSNRLRQAEHRARKRQNHTGNENSVTQSNAVSRSVTESNEEKRREEKRREKKDHAPSADARELAAYLHSAILAHTPDFSASTRAWPAQAEKALRQGLAISRLRAAIDFVHGGGRGDWWRPYILSVGALAKKLPTLEMQARQTPPGQRRQVTIEESGLRDAGEYLASLRVVGDE